MSTKNNSLLNKFKTSISDMVFELAFLVMLFSKLFGYTPNLSWWIVTSPLWIPIALCFICFFIFYCITIVSIILYAIFLGLIFIGSLLSNKISTIFLKNKKGK